nr:SLAM family member 7-like isoform X2 [Misgurnus anguillicaudatus]
MALHIFIFSTVVLFSKECMTETLFVQMGTSIQLNISKLTAENNTLLWSKDKLNVVRYEKPKDPKIPDSHKNKVVFNSTNLSLTLKNMQKNDSGPYKAITRGDSDIVVAEYIVSVIDGVDAPELTVISNWSSSDSCTVNFTCRAHNLTLNSTYENNSCSVGGDSLEIFTLILNCTEDSIICNHSNPVSRKIETQEVKQLCPQYYKNHKQQTGSFQIPWFVYPCILGALLIFGLVYFFFRNKNKGLKQLDNTIYAEVESRQMQSGKKECHVYELPEMMCPTVQSGNNKPQTTYSTVGQHRKPHKKTRKPSQEVPTNNILSIYSVVSKLPDVSPVD